MAPDELISAAQFCEHHNIEFSFIQALSEFGLIEVVSFENKPFIPVIHLKNTEQMVRLHYNLDINLEGIDAISHLLQKVVTLQKEIVSLQNRLGFYEQ